MLRERILVILVNWKRASDTIACIHSLLDCKQESLTITVCDNASPDDSYSIIKESLSSPAGNFTQVSESDQTTCFVFAKNNHHVLLTKTANNLGFAGGNNYGHKQSIIAYGDVFSHVWFLNNDTEQDANCLPAMLRKFSAPSHAPIGIVGSTMLYDFDRKTVQAFGGSLYKPLTGLMQEIGNGQTWPCPVDEAQVEAQMSYVCGASMLVSSQLIRDVGLMTEDYFIFFEEIDWCQRAKRAGYSLAYAHDAIVYHKEGASIGTGTGAKRSLLAEYYGLRNKLLVTWRFFPWAMPSVWLISWLQAARRLAQRRPRNAWLMARVLLGIGQRPS